MSLQVFKRCMSKLFANLIVGSKLFHTLGAIKEKKFCYPTCFETCS